MTVLSALGALSLAFLMLFWLSPIGAPTLKRLGEGKLSPDLTFGYGPEDTYRLLEVYGQRGIAHWRRLLLLDMIFPGVYGALLALLASRWAIWADAGPAWRAVAIACPTISAAADYFENILLLYVIASVPKKFPFAVTAASAFTRIKFAFLVAALVIPLAHWGLTQLSRLA
jgi:hypothetical protein